MYEIDFDIIGSYSIWTAWISSGKRRMFDLQSPGVPVVQRCLSDNTPQTGLLSVFSTSSSPKAGTPGRKDTTGTPL